MKILTVSDVEVGFIYSPHITERFADVDLVISCGDLPYYYLEYIISVLDKPMLHVRGNHAHAVEHGSGGDRRDPWGAVDLHNRVICHDGLLLAGMQGSLQYNYGKYQYSQSEMWMMVWGMVPRLFWNRLRYGRYLDIFVSHAPPRHVHDQEDRPHQGFNAYRWLHRVFRPAYHFHGHIHIYRNDVVMDTLFYETRVINTYGYKETVIDAEALRARSLARKPDPAQEKADA